MLRLIGGAVLVLGLPLALMAVVALPNEYEAYFDWRDIADCDGPFELYIFAIPALLIYGTGLLLNARKWRRRANLVIAILCFLVLVPVAANTVRAVLVDMRQSADCAEINR